MFDLLDFPLEWGAELGEWLLEILWHGIDLFCSHPAQHQPTVSSTPPAARREERDTADRRSALPPPPSRPSHGEY